MPNYKNIFYTFFWGFCFSVIFQFTSLWLTPELWAQMNEHAEIVNQILDQEESLSPADTDAPLEPAPPKIIDVLDLKSIDINEALSTIAVKSGLTIVPELEVTGPVTLYLTQVDALDALRIIVDMADLAYLEKDNSYHVMTKEKFRLIEGSDFDEKIQSKVIRLKYRKPSELISVLEKMKTMEGKIMADEENSSIIVMDSPDVVASMLSFIGKYDIEVFTETVFLKFMKAKEALDHIRGLLTKSVGRADFDEAANSVIMTDTAPKLQEMKSIIERSDQTYRDVIFHVRILQIYLNDEHLEGVDWEAIVTDYQDLNFAGFEHAGDQPNKLRFGTLSEEDYDVLLDALDTVGYIYTVSNNEIKSTFDEVFEIDVHSTQLSKLFDDESAAPESDEPRQEIKLYITPEIIDRDLFSVNLKPQFISIEGQLPARQYITAPSDPSDLQVKIKESSTIVIGGLFKDVMIKPSKKIPILDDVRFWGEIPILKNLPILRYAFGKRKERLQKTEIIIFLTPKRIGRE